MRPTKYNHPLAHYADKWGTTSTTVRRYAAKGCNWDADDYTVACWLLRHGHKKPKAMYAAIYAVPGITDPHAPKPELKQPIDRAAVMAAYLRSCELEAMVAELKPGDVEAALKLSVLVDENAAELDRLSGI